MREKIDSLRGVGLGSGCEVVVEVEVELELDFDVISAFSVDFVVEDSASL